MPYQIDYVSSWQARLSSRLYSQFRSAVTWQGWTVLLGRQFQDLEDAIQSLLGIWDYTNNSGALLDIVGNLVGQPRLGNNDATYLIYIAGRIVANHSTGTVEDIFNVMRAIFGPNAAPRYTAGRVKQFAVTITGVPLTIAQAVIGASFLNDTKEAGARGILIYGSAPKAQLFTYDTGPGYDVGVYMDAIQAGS